LLTRNTTNLPLLFDFAETRLKMFLIPDLIIKFFELRPHAPSLRRYELLKFAECKEVVELIANFA